jgi:hypothetical protein
MITHQVAKRPAGASVKSEAPSPSSTEEAEVESEAEPLQIPESPPEDDMFETRCRSHPPPSFALADRAAHLYRWTLYFVLGAMMGVKSKKHIKTVCRVWSHKLSPEPGFVM